jgi:hypothetical protein
MLYNFFCFHVNDIFGEMKMLFGSYCTQKQEITNIKFKPPQLLNSLAYVSHFPCSARKPNPFYPQYNPPLP